jgi:hypothetical protein
MSNINNSTNIITHYAGKIDTIPSHMKVMNPEYNEEANAFDLSWDDHTTEKFIEAFLMDSLRLMRDCTPGTKQYVELKNFIFSDDFLLYCDALNLNGKELQNGVHSIIYGGNFSDTRSALSPHESAMHHDEMELEAEQRRVKYFS